MNRYRVSYSYCDASGGVHYGEEVRYAKTEWAAEDDLIDDMAEEELDVDVYRVELLQPVSRIINWAIIALLAGAIAIWVVSFAP